MRRPKTDRQMQFSCKITPEIRRLLEVLTAQFTLSHGRRYTFTDVIEEALRQLAAQAEQNEHREGV